MPHSSGASSPSRDRRSSAARACSRARSGYRRSPGVDRLGGALVAELGIAFLDPSQAGLGQLDGRQPARLHAAPPPPARRDRPDPIGWVLWDRASSRRLASVDGVDGAGDERGLVAEQKGGQRRHLVGGAEPSLGRSLLGYGAELGGKAIEQRRVDRARSDGVDPYPLRRILDRRRPGEADDRRLGGAVGAQAGDAVQAGAR